MSEIGAVGTTVSVPHLAAAGLAPTGKCLIRQDQADLWNALSASSCLVEGPPGSGKSTATWHWLLQRVKTTHSTALWFHFNKLGDNIATIIRFQDDNFSFESVEEDDKFRARDYRKLGVQTCVVDGVTKDNLEKAGGSWRVFGGSSRSHPNRHMVWVSNQSLAIPIEHLDAANMTSFSFFSWSKEQVKQCAGAFSDQEKQLFVQDVVSATPQNRLEPGVVVDFDLALEIKMYYCGCSARWLFGYSMERAIQDIHAHLAKVEDLEQAISVAKANGASGVSFFAYGNLKDEYMGILR